MTRRMTSGEIGKRAKARREGGLALAELRAPTTPRVSAAGVVSAAVKADDPEIRRLIDEALARRLKENAAPEASGAAKEPIAQGGGRRGSIG